jgi:PAS domain S-box-containing protein
MRNREIAGGCLGALDKDQLIAELDKLRHRIAELENETKRRPQRGAEKALRASESRLEQAQRTAQVGDWQFDMGTEELVWSAEIYRIFGTTSADFKPSVEGFYEFVHPDDKERIRSLIEEGYSAGRQFSFEHRIVLANGEIRWVVQENVLVQDGGSELDKRRGTVQNITERKLAEEALTKSAAQQRLLMNSLPALIAYLDADKRYRSVNRAFEEWFQVSLADVLGRTVEDVIGAENYSRISDYIERVVAGEQVSYERTLTYPGEKKRVIHATLIPDFDSENIVGGYFALVTDITERKAIEEALRAGEEMLRGIFETEAVGIAITALDGSFIQSNGAYQAMMGWSAEELSNKTFFDLTYEEDHAETGKRHAELLSGGVDSYQQNKRYLHKDGSVIWANVNAARLMNAEGEIIGDIAVVEDITRRREIEAQLLQSQKMEAVGQLTGGVAHDFNNLLTVISGSLHLLEDSGGAARGRNDLIRRALEAVERGADLTQRLLAFSRTQRLQPDAIDAGKLVLGMIEILERTLGATIEIVTSQPDDLWPCETDPSQLENAILNLAINARDAMPGGGRLTIESENIELGGEYANLPAGVASGDYVVLTVSDSGEGIPKDVLAHVFEPFYTTKGVGKGSGLGLSMVYGFAQQSGGHATIYSEEGLGAAVKIYLPRATSEAAPALSVQSSVAVPQAKGETILVVEDDPDVRTLAVALLSKLGYEIVEAADAKSALALLPESEKIDLLLSDIVLPGKMNGVELAVEVRALQPQVKMVFMSGYTQRAFDAEGVDGLDYIYIQKPFGKPVLAKAIRDALDL